MSDVKRLWGNALTPAPLPVMIAPMNEKWFLWLGRMEGLSLLFLMFIAMPVKYLLQNPEWVKHSGRLHGGLFIAYCVAALFLSEKRNWSRNTLALAWGFSCLPFGTFIFEKKYLPKSV